MVEAENIIDDPFYTEMIEAIKRYEESCLIKQGYMPALATVLRIIADEYADKYPDDANGGFRG